MLVIARTLYFLTLAVEVAIIAVIVLMILRLIGDAADLNPFGWASRTLRRLTDVFIIPVRATMREVGMDGKFAPLVVILISVLLGFFMVQLLTTIANTVDGVISSVLAGAVIAAVGYILYGLLSFYIL